MIIKQRRMVQQIISMDALKETNSSTVILNAQHFEVIRLRDKKCKLRRLTDKKYSTNVRKKYLSLIAVIVCFTSILIFAKIYNVFNIENSFWLIYQTFVTNYRNQFKEIAQGKSVHCTQQFNIEILNETIQNHGILHQDKAIQQVFDVLKWEQDPEIGLDSGGKHRLRTMVFVGTHGVGKTLLSTAIMDGFTWPNNVHRYIWTTKVGNENQRFHLLRVIIEQLSECGWNLLIIDNLNVCDYALVPIINKQFLQVTANTQKRLVIIYIFSLNTLMSNTSLVEQMRYIEDLDVTKLIYFKQFNRSELLQCIYREIVKEEVTLKMEDLDDILDAIDPLESGCKNVNAKVLMYGTIKRSLAEISPLN